MGYIEGIEGFQNVLIVVLFFACLVYLGGAITACGSPSLPLPEKTLKPVRILKFSVDALVFLFLVFVGAFGSALLWLISLALFVTQFYFKHRDAVDALSKAKAK
jgi:hypothetical protein